MLSWLSSWSPSPWSVDESGGGEGKEGEPTGGGEDAQAGAERKVSLGADWILLEPAGIQVVSSSPTSIKVSSVPLVSCEVSVESVDAEKPVSPPPTPPPVVGAARAASPPAVAAAPAPALPALLPLQLADAELIRLVAHEHRRVGVRRSGRIQLSRQSPRRPVPSPSLRRALLQPARRSQRN
jgi:hypothetical protein